MQVNLSSQTLLYFLLVLVGISGVSFTFFLPAPVGFYAAIIAAGAAGFGVAANVYETKRVGQQLVCPAGSDCNTVVNSRYAKFFGIPLEYLGMTYYALIVFAYAVLIFASQTFSPWMILGVVILSALAGLFSLYLLFVQAVLLREWCIWCILSALLSLGICVLSFVSTQTVINLLGQFSVVIELIRSLGFTLGVGGVSAAGLLFFQFLKDKSISEKELAAIEGVFELVWVGLGLVITGQFGLYILRPDVLAQSAVFQIQMVALAIAILAGAALMIVYTPFLPFIPFERLSADNEDVSFMHLRRPVLVLGAISAACWYFAFTIDFFSGGSLPVYGQILGLVLAVIVGMTLCWDAYLSQPADKRPEGKLQ